jgi:hypothetical protein
MAWVRIAAAEMTGRFSSCVARGFTMIARALGVGEKTVEACLQAL